MKFLIVGDLHGNKPIIKRKGFDAIIAPGDFCSDAPRKFMFKALKKRLENPELKINWYDITGKVKAKEMINKSLSDGRLILEELNSYEVPVYIVPGNWDWFKEKKPDWGFLKKNHYKRLIKGLKNIKDCYHKIIDIDDYEIIGHGVTSGPEYPQYDQDLERFTEKELLVKKKDYDNLFNKVNKLFNKASKPVIFLSHNVPFNTPIDVINNPASPRNGQHFGSLIAREMINEHQPLVCIGGHMHEHHTKCLINKTTCINAGYGSKVNTWLELVYNQIINLKFFN